MSIHQSSSPEVSITNAQQNFLYYVGKTYAITCIYYTFVVVCASENVENSKQSVSGIIFLRIL